MKQQQRIFFDDTPPTNEELQQMVSRSNPKSPFSKFVGNDKSLTKLQAAAFDALGKQNHMMRDLAFAIFGPAIETIIDKPPFKILSPLAPM